jgi:hypothetical protein
MAGVVRVIRYIGDCAGRARGVRVGSYMPAGGPASTCTYATAARSRYVVPIAYCNRGAAGKEKEKEKRQTTELTTSWHGRSLCESEQG